MLSWKTIRLISTVLLLLPLVHLAFLLSRDTLATLDPSPEVWADELEDYARLDRASPLPEQPVVITGGRRVKLWKNLDEIIDEPLLMRGLGQAIIEDITHNYAALIGYYRPDTVVILPGYSEFHIRDNKSARELVDALRNLESVDAAHGITRNFYIFTPLKTPLSPEDDAKIERATEALQEWDTASERVTVLDSNSLLSGRDGEPDAAYYLADGINLNDRGYLRLSMMLHDQLEADSTSTSSVP